MTKAEKNICLQEKNMLRLTFNPGSGVAGFRTTRICFQNKSYNEMSSRDPTKTYTWHGQLSTSKQPPDLDEL